ncbi:PH and SEC7 domain-containing protein 1-like [Clarias magur]|uniref:PH and SEC7 domain-containing protein 1-like n=1 Tax=Clarias magur TaxID=1594786 RepID=A0A8J4XA59_CLAMG|nr:PH and SEC7 domain-containing protein 1-like [Clarias magur]
MMMGLAWVILFKSGRPDLHQQPRQFTSICEPYSAVSRVTASEPLHLQWQQLETPTLYMPPKLRHIFHLPLSKLTQERWKYKLQ